MKTQDALAAVAALALAIGAGTLVAANIDRTSTNYKPTNGQSNVQGVVLQQSADGYNALPVNSAYPLPVTLTGGGGSTTPSDSFANPTTASTTSSLVSTWNPTASVWERSTSNLDLSILASAARSASANSADITNYSHSCVHVVLNATVLTATSVTLTIQGKDAVSGSYYTILAGGAVATAGTNVYKVCPGITSAASSSSDVMPRTWRVSIAQTGTTATYSVGASLVN